MMVHTPQGIGEVINQPNEEGDVMVILRKRDNSEWRFEGNFVFRIFNVGEVEIL